jgi:hypothetical protein
MFSGAIIEVFLISVAQLSESTNALCIRTTCIAKHHSKPMLNGNHLTHHVIIKQGLIFTGYHLENLVICLNALCYLRRAMLYANFWPVL